MRARAERSEESVHASTRTTAVKPHRCGAREQKERRQRGNISGLGTQPVRRGCVWVPSSDEDAERLRSCGAALGTHTQPHRRATGGAELWNISKAERSLALLVWNSLRPSICAAVPKRSVVTSCTQAAKPHKQCVGSA